ncbi:MAG: 2-oxo-hept-4-ene-1,7-dioate hydratase [Pseudomonadota bacterium]
MTPDDVARAARMLDDAEIRREQIRPLTLDFPDMGMDQAYAVQAAWIERKLARGASVTGYKIGLTSRTMQRTMNIDTPDSGVLLDDMAFANGADIRAADFLDPRIEAEFAFVLAAPLAGSHVGIDDVLAATAYVVPALELISARSTRTDPATGYTRKVFDTIADNAANAGYIPGEVRIDPGAIDLRWQGALLAKDGVIEDTGLGAAVLDHPARGICWLCERLAAYGQGLDAGQFVLSGSFTGAVPVTAGTRIRADYGDFGTIDVGFV